jgi:hypothetical protein
MPQKASLLKQRIKKPKLLRSNPTRVALLNLQDNDDDIGIGDEDLHVGYRRPSLVTEKKSANNDDDELSDEIKWKLFLARQVALIKYKEKWG